MADWGEIIGGTLGIASGGAVAGSVTSVGSVSADETLGQIGSDGLSECFDTSSVTSKEVTPHTAEGLTTAPSQAGGFVAGATVVGGASGIVASVAPATSPIESCSGAEGFPLPGGGRLWEDSSGNIHIDSNTIPYSRVERRAQQTYDLLHGKRSTQYDFPVAIIETADVLEAFENVFGKNPSIGKIHESLTVMKMALEQQINEGNS